MGCEQNVSFMVLTRHRNVKVQCLSLMHDNRVLKFESKLVHPLCDLCYEAKNMPFKLQSSLLLLAETTSFRKCQCLCLRGLYSGAIQYTVSTFLKFKREQLELLQMLG
jgi:hypothetical protein